MTQKPAGYDNPIVTGMSAKVIGQLQGRCATEHATMALEDLKHAVKFSLGEVDNLPEVCALNDKAQRFGPINLPFNLMALEFTSDTEDGQHDHIYLYKRISPDTVRVFCFVRWRRADTWNVMKRFVDVQSAVGQAHQLKVCPSGQNLDEEDQATMISIADQIIFALRSLNALIECNNVGVETVPAPEKKGQKLGKRKRELLKFEYRILIIKGRKDYEGRGLGSHRSPRLHLRSGHIRKLPTGKKTWVSSCAVGANKRGTIQKDYLVEVRP